MLMKMTPDQEEEEKKAAQVIEVDLKLVFQRFRLGQVQLKDILQNAELEKNPINDRYVPTTFWSL